MNLLLYLKETKKKLKKNLREEDINVNFLFLKILKENKMY